MYCIKPPISILLTLLNPLSAIVVIAALMALCAYFAYHRQGKVQALLDVQSATIQAPGVELNTLNPVLKGKKIEEIPKSQDVSEIARRWDPRWG
jgi:hypothetical protein